MNILVFSWRDPKHPQGGGAEQVMHEHMKFWVKKGHTVTLFSSHFKKGERNEVLDGIKIKRYGFQILGVHVIAPLWYFLGKHEKFDLVVDQFHGIPFFTPLYIGSKKIAVIQEVAREVWLENPLPFPANKIIGYMGYYGEPMLFKIYRKIPFITGSESAKKDLLEVGLKENNINIIPHGVIVKNTKKSIKKEKKKTIIYLGALTKDKGVEDAIKCFSILSKNKNYQFWIVGKGQDAYVEKLKEKSKKIKNLTYFGFVSIEKKFELLKRAHLLINPSIREGWGLVNIEANRMETPVVAYNSSGLVDSVRDKESGIICKKNTPNELAKNIEYIFGKQGLYKKMQKNAKKWSDKFTWEKSAKMSLDLIEKL